MQFIFSNLSPEDFEGLCQDVVSRVMGEHFERFKSGKDSGVDLRLLQGESKVIAQVKHRVGSYGASHRSMLKKEFGGALAKITAGTRYLLLTSLGLSPYNKSEILKLSSGLIVSESDIIGIQEIEDILNKNEDIVKRHYKLWLSSAAVLTRLLNNKVIGKSEDYLSYITKRIRLFVETKRFHYALKFAE